MKMSIASKNRSNETLKKLSESKKGTKLSEETKLKISLSHKNQTAEQRENRKTFKKVKCTKTNKIYANTDIVCSLFDINKNTLQKKLRGERHNNTNFIYLKNA